MYFALLGKHTHISMEELRYIQPTDFRTYNPQIVFFDTQFPQRLNNLAGIVKRGIVYNYNDIKKVLIDCPIIGVHDSKFGKQAKEHFGIRRFKLLEPLKTDKEIKNKGKEVLVFQTKEGQSYGLVTGYQNIARYETIDFDKPARSMQVGMMPAKLTHIMINIGLTYTNMDTISNIYDPFCGLGTTLLMANALWYHAIWSDIEPKHAEKNINRRKQQSVTLSDSEEYNKKHVISSGVSKTNAVEKSHELKTKSNIYLFQHDVTRPFTESKLENVALIVSEWRLWPIVTEKTTTQQAQEYSHQVIDIYKKFLTNTSQYFTTHKPTIIMTIPHYVNHENRITDIITKHATSLGRNSKVIKEIYIRPRQHLGRQILILTPSI